MARSRFTKGEVERLPLSDGDWVEVKRQLSIFDRKRIESGALTPIVVNGQLFQPMDWSMYEINRMAVQLVDWSLRGKDDKPMRLSIDAIKALEPGDFKEIADAIEKFYEDSALPKGNELSLAPGTGSDGSSATAESQLPKMV